MSALLVAGATAQDDLVAPLAVLKKGQVIDRDPLTKLTTTVTAIGQVGARRTVVITEENEIERMEYHYDARSGGLVRLRAINRLHHQDTLVRLVSTR